MAGGMMLRCGTSLSSNLSTRRIKTARSHVAICNRSPCPASFPIVSSWHAVQVRQVQTRVAAPENGLTEEQMFCYQCEQTLHGTGCTKVGVCGKIADVAGLQDLLVYMLKGLGAWAHLAHEKTGLTTPEVDSFVKAAVFSTLTNVNFDPDRFQRYILQCQEYRDMIRNKLRKAGVFDEPPTPELSWVDLQQHPVQFDLSSYTKGDNSVERLTELGKQVSLAHRKTVMVGQETILGLQELLMYGLKGMAAYAHHAEMLGAVDPAVDDACEEILAFLGSEESNDPSKVLEYCLHCGEVNFRVMQLLDGAHTGRYGHPVPTPVPITPKKGKAILISGHDMRDCEELLKQTEGLGINVYTHGEMLPAHGYPGLKKFPHLYGHYGGAWYKQKKEFAEFPGAILMTTNCILEPTIMYADHLFTAGEVGVISSKHISGRNYSAVIQKALEMPGFTWEPAEAMSVTVGFGHNTVLGVADKVVEAIQAKQLNHIFLVGGCDAPEPSRKYYTEVTKNAPADSMVLTLGCGKFRFHTHDFGTLPNGLPRLLDMGQCNDAYGALVVATKLAEVLGTDVNSLPLSLDISWFEQKAVAVLLTLLHLGVKNIRLGPNLPAFVTPEALELLVKTFDIKAADVKDPKADLERMLAGH